MVELLEHTQTALTRQSEKRLESTVQAYEKHFEEYAKTTPTNVTGAMRDWLDNSFSSLAHTAKILEIGSGTGRDAAYVETHGYRVKRSDKVESFVELLRAQGHEAVVLDAIHDAYPQNLDLIFANAVACHFDRSQMDVFLRQAHKALLPGGQLAFTTKVSSRYRVQSQDRLGSPRLFTSWPPTSLRRFVEKRGFYVKYWTSSAGINSKSAWLNVVLGKDMMVSSYTQE